MFNPLGMLRRSLGFGPYVHPVWAITHVGDNGYFGKKILEEGDPKCAVFFYSPQAAGEYIVAQTKKPKKWQIWGPMRPVHFLRALKTIKAQPDWKYVAFDPPAKGNKMGDQMFDLEYIYRTVQEMVKAGA